MNFINCLQLRPGGAHTGRCPGRVEMTADWPRSECRHGGRLSSMTSRIGKQPRGCLPMLTARKGSAGRTRTSSPVLVQFANAASITAARDLMTLVLEETVPAPRKAVTAATTMTKTAAAFMTDSRWNLESRPAPTGQWIALGGLRLMSAQMHDHLR